MVSDLQFAVRALRKDPGFTLGSALTLALGIGANTAIFSVVNAVILRPLPVERPNELVSFATEYPAFSDGSFSYAAYRQFAVEAAAVIDPIAASAARRDAIAMDGPPEVWTSSGFPATISRRWGSLPRPGGPTAVSPSAVTGTLYRELAAVDRRLAVVAMTGLREQVDASLVPERLTAKLSAAFGLLALTLAAIGPYGVIAYVTARRAGEIGIRMALGADRGEVRGLVLRDTLKLLVIGVAIGIPVALAAGRLLASQLYAVAPGDPLAVSLGLVTLSVTALVAGYVPAWRAASVSPTEALRQE